MKNILKVILCVLVCYIAIGLGWMTKDIIIHENGKDGIAILGYHGVVSEQEKKENYASNPYFMSISEFEKQMKYLADNNYQCLSMEDVETYYHGKYRLCSVHIDQGGTSHHCNIHRIKSRINNNSCKKAVNTQLCLKYGCHKARAYTCSHGCKN